jgi:hypothetical protein
MVDSLARYRVSGSGQVPCRPRSFKLEALLNREIRRLIVAYMEMEAVRRGQAVKLHLAMV